MGLIRPFMLALSINLRLLLLMLTTTSSVRLLDAAVCLYLEQGKPRMQAKWI